MLTIFGKLEEKTLTHFRENEKNLPTSPSFLPACNLWHFQTNLCKKCVCLCLHPGKGCYPPGQSNQRIKINQFCQIGLPHFGWLSSVKSCASMISGGPFIIFSISSRLRKNMARLRRVGKRLNLDNDLEKKTKRPGNLN